MNKIHLREGHVQMANYTVFRTSEKTVGDGSTIFVKNTIVYNVADVDEVLNLEATAVEMVTATAHTIRLVPIYYSANWQLLGLTVLK